MDATQTQNENGDGGETTAISNGVVCYDTWEQMQDSWLARAKVLMEEARGFGFASVFSLCSFDRLDDDGTTPSLSLRRGNYYTCLGMIEDMKGMLMRGEM